MTPAGRAAVASWTFAELARIPDWLLDNGQRVIGRTSATEMLTGIKGGGALEKYLGVAGFKPFIDMNLVLERAESLATERFVQLGEFDTLTADNATWGVERTTGCATNATGKSKGLEL